MKYSNLDKIRIEVDSIIREFSFGLSGKGFTERIAESYVKCDGQRHRPFLLLAFFWALSDIDEIPLEVKEAVVAVECMHKASLIHDDIEDGDSWRGANPTLHVSHGVPTALNTGDFLAGEAYSLLVRSSVDMAQKLEILAELCDTQRRLCIGQGDDLKYRGKGATITLEVLFGIYKNKTSSLFFLPMYVGSLLAGSRYSNMRTSIRRIAEVLGIAYQIKDDLVDPGKGDVELSVLNILSRKETEKLFWEKFDETVRAMSVFENPLLVECVKDILRFNKMER